MAQNLWVTIQGSILWIPGNTNDRFPPKLELQI